jgi:CheY-like chemotaxis protein
VTKKILIVEDDPVVAQLLKEFFNQFQHGRAYEIETAGDGASAIMALLHQRFDLVVLDLTMPRMGGLEMLNQMRGLDLRPPTIVLTGNVDSTAAREALRSGIFAYLPKPVELRQLDHIVTLALSTPSETR